MLRPNPRSMYSTGDLDYGNISSFQEDDDQDTDAYGMPLKTTTKLEAKPSRLKLSINPRSLFRKRRTEPEFSPTLRSPVTNTGQFPQPSTDFDPRIRGPGVHDFSVPRKLSTGTFATGMHEQSSRQSHEYPYHGPQPRQQFSPDGYKTTPIFQSPLEREEEGFQRGSIKSLRTSSLKRGPSSTGSRFSFDVVSGSDSISQERRVIDGTQRKKKTGKAAPSISGSIDSLGDDTAIEEDMYDPNDIPYGDDDDSIPGYGKPNISEMTLEDFDRQQPTHDDHDLSAVASNNDALMTLPQQEGQLQNYEAEEDELYFDDGFMDGQPSPGEGSFDEDIFDQMQPGERIGLGTGNRDLRGADGLRVLSSLTSITPDSVSTIVDKSRQSSLEAAQLDEANLHDNALHYDELRHDPPRESFEPEPSFQLQEPFQPDPNWKSPYQIKPRSSSLSAGNLPSSSPDQLPRSGGVVRFDLYSDNQSTDLSGYSTDLESSVDIAANTSAPWDDDNLDGFEGEEDDEMIALANAEALENDEDGTYGREFGFYARSSNRGQNELVDGGYYGSNGWSGVRRSHSGKTVALEPNLTPISERSEASQRNSLASLTQAHDLSLVQEVGLKLSQIALDLAAGEGHDHDPEMSFEHLAKLRRSAWGQKGNSRPNSGQTEISTQSISHEPRIETDHAMINHSSADNNNPSPALSSISTFGKPPRPAFMSHSRNSSGGGSVSYVLERDEDGVSSRWIVERRRMNENGTAETVAREVLQGGRI